MTRFWAAVFGYEPDFPGPISYTDFDTAMIIEADSLLEAAHIANAWAERHNQLNHSDGCELLSVTRVEPDEDEVEAAPPSGH
jgi:hypothetical protein